MRTLIFFLAIALTPVLASCEKQTEKAQADIKKGNPEGGVMKKKYEAAAKDTAERNQAAEK